MTKPDYPDFTQAVAVQEQDVTVLDETGGQNPGTVTTRGDTSGLQSVVLGLTLPGGAAGERSALQVQWLAGNFLVSVDNLTFHSLITYPNRPFGLVWQLPVRGTGVECTFISDGASALQYIVLGSTRPIVKPTITYVANNQSRRRLDTGNQAVGAGATVGPFYAPPSAGPIVVRSNATTGLVTVRVNPVDYQGAVMAAGSVLCNVTSPGTAQPFAEVDAPGMGLEVSLINTDTAAHTFSATIWDVN